MVPVKNKKLLYAVSVLSFAAILFMTYIFIFICVVDIKDIKMPMYNSIMFKYSYNASRLYLISENDDGSKEFFTRNLPNQNVDCAYSRDSIYVTLKGESKYFWRIFKPLEYVAMKYRGITPIVLTNAEFEKLKMTRDSFLKNEQLDSSAIQVIVN